MHYTALARELATELGAPDEDVLSDLMSAIREHRWPLDLDEDQVVLTRLAVADRVEVWNRLT